MDTHLLDKLGQALRDEHTNHIPEILVAGSPGYERRRHVFNTKFQFHPSAIVLVENVAQVSAIVKFAHTHAPKVVLRARSGGHDHEGESCGTNVLLIDLSKMNSVTVQPGQEEPIVTIGAGARFEHIKPILDAAQIGIAHGTCKTVGIAGFTMGGGWGPWTRLHGMGCERLIGATLVLGDGEIVELRSDAPKGSHEEKLLWALRGGGGFSYGIVTELRFQAFKLPESLCTFHLDCAEALPDCSAIEIVKRWEQAITGNTNPKLIGTNLMVAACHRDADQAPDPNARLGCTFNGYFAGTCEEADAMIVDLFGERARGAVRYQTVRSAANGLQNRMASPQWTFGGWDRVTRTARLGQSGATYVNDIELETEGPAPHKITSRLANPSGWNDESRKALICALQSPLVPTDEEQAKNPYPMSQYITLGAITGPFYATCDEETRKSSAFPYKDRLFTIQFQAWWDEYLYPDWTPRTRNEKEIDEATLANRPFINRAEDWIAACRDYTIPGTDGAFISFKDSSVETETYFAQNYDRLREVKEECSKDEYLLFRTRKTII